MASNGYLSQSELAPIPGGYLAKDAAAAWNAPGGPADAGLRPGGSDSSYRSYARQVYYWDLYQNHNGNLAAYPGESNHGWGIAVDIPNAWEQAWMREHGAKYGWAKTEAFSEPWHWNYVGGVHFPTFDILEHGDKGLRVVKFTKRLAYIRAPGDGPYLEHKHWRYDDHVVKAVRHFQTKQSMQVDGRIGPKTAARINGTFRRQWHRRHDRR